MKDLPELPRGKGNKIFGLSSKKVASREEYLAAIAVVAPQQNLIVRSGERKMTLKFSELKDYRGERAQRGAVLPRGWRKVERLDVEDQRRQAGRGVSTSKSGLLRPGRSLSRSSVCDVRTGGIPPHPITTCSGSLTK